MVKLERSRSVPFVGGILDRSAAPDPGKRIQSCISGKKEGA